QLPVSVSFLQLHRILNPVAGKRRNGTSVSGLGFATSLFGMPEQFRGAVEVAGPVGVEERVEPRPLLGEIDDPQAKARGPDIDLADALDEDRLAQRVAQPHRPKADDRVWAAAGRRAGELGLGL